jgi:sulfonate transport system substrate-binding protein
VKNGARIVAKGAPPIDQLNSYYVASQKSLDDPERRAALADVLTRVAKTFNYGLEHRDEYAKAVAKDTGISFDDAKTSVDAYSFKVTPFIDEDLEAQQSLADAFLEAGEITKEVDVSKIYDNILPADFDSTKLD